jgi:hypothetical protein
VLLSFNCTLTCCENVFLSVGRALVIKDLVPRVLSIGSLVEIVVLISGFLS